MPPRRPRAPPVALEPRPPWNRRRAHSPDPVRVAHGLRRPYSQGADPPQTRHRARGSPEPRPQGVHHQSGRASRTASGAAASTRSFCVPWYRLTEKVSPPWIRPRQVEAKSFPLATRPGVQPRPGLLALLRKSRIGPQGEGLAVPLPRASAFSKPPSTPHGPDSGMGVFCRFPPWALHPHHGAGRPGPFWRRALEHSGVNGLGDLVDDVWGISV